MDVLAPVSLGVAETAWPLCLSPSIEGTEDTGDLGETDSVLWLSVNGEDCCTDVTYTTEEKQIRLQNKKTRTGACEYTTVSHLKPQLNIATGRGRKQLRGVISNRLKQQCLPMRNSRLTHFSFTNGNMNWSNKLPLNELKWRSENYRYISFHMGLFTFIFSTPENMGFMTYLLVL